MFKKLISFATILFAISFNNSESSCLCFRANGYDIVTENWEGKAFGANCFNSFARRINEYAGNYLNVDSVESTDNNKNIVFRGIRNLAPYKTVGLTGYTGFRPNITFDCGNNDVNFPEIILNNINSFTIISSKLVVIKNLFTHDEAANEQTYHKFTINPPCRIFEFSCISK